MKILVPTGNRFIRPRNTDWQYAARTLPLLSGHCPDFEVSIQNNRLADVEINFRYALSMAGGRGVNLLPRRWHYALEQDCPLYRSDVDRLKPDVILSYERYPRNSFGLPVVWVTSPSYADVMLSNGVTAEQVDRSTAWKQSRARKAARLVFTTEVALNTFVKQYGESLREKSVAIPFFLPGLDPLENCTTKWKQKELRFLFVGRQAHRKGLPAVLDGLLPLLTKHPHTSLTIISSWDDGPVDIPSRANITTLGETKRERILQIMADSHFFVMPSSFESYGFVYIEAMSQGCIPLALDRPIQREIIADSGILISAQLPEQISKAFADVISNTGFYSQKAQAALINYKTRFAPARVAAQIRDVCQAAILQPEAVCR